VDWARTVDADDSNRTNAIAWRMTTSSLNRFSANSG